MAAAAAAGGGDWGAADAWADWGAGAGGGSGAAGGARQGAARFRPRDPAGPPASNTRACAAHSQDAARRPRRCGPAAHCATAVLKLLPSSHVLAYILV